MKKSIVLAAFALAFAVGTTLASETPQSEPQQGEADRTTICERLKSRGASPKQLAQEDCCSQRGGICGCEYGQIVCCDGNYSNCAC